MNTRAWLAYGVLFGHALSATLPTVSRREDDRITLPSKLSTLGYVSAITANTSSSHDVPDVNLIALNNASQRPSNYSTSIYDLPSDYNFPSTTTSAPQCNASSYGSNLDRYSCFDAWRYIGMTPNRVSWGPRGLGHGFHYKLPVRWSSGKFARASRI